MGVPAEVPQREDSEDTGQVRGPGKSHDTGQLRGPGKSLQRIRAGTEPTSTSSTRVRRMFFPFLVI